MKRLMVLMLILLAVMLISGAGYLGSHSSGDAGGLDALLTAVGLGRRQAQTDSEPSAPPTMPVTRGDVQQTVAAPGQLVNTQEAVLGLDVGGRLIEINVRPGDVVHQGDVLAHIDATVLERAVIQAEADLTMAQDDLEKALNPYTELDRAQARLALQQAEVALEQATNNLEQVRNPATYLDLTEAGLAMDQARTKLEEARENLTGVKAGPADAQLASAEAALASAEESYARLLAKPDPEAVEQAKLRLDQARNSLWSIQMGRDSNCGAAARGDASKAACDSANAQVANAEISVRLAEIIHQQAQTPATAAEIANAAAQVQQARETVQQLRNSPTSLDLAQAEKQVTQTEYNLAKAEENLAEVEAGADPLELTLAETRVAQAEYDLAKAQETLVEIEGGPDPKEIAVAQVKVVSAQASLEEAKAALEAVTIIAPFDCIVLEVKARPGETVAAGASLVVLTDPTAVEVRSTVIEEDLPLVQVGQLAELFFDAVPEAAVMGRVARIVPQRVAGEGRPLYHVYIAPEELSEGLLPGMTVDASIIIAQQTGVLRLPRALVRAGSGGATQVEVWADGHAQKRVVQLGLRGDVYIEILKGLNEGELVVGQ